MHEIKVHVQGCNRGKPSPEACREFLVHAAALFLQAGLRGGKFEPRGWSSRFTAEQRRAKATLLLTQGVKDLLEDLRLEVSAIMLKDNEVVTPPLADIIEMGIDCMKQEGFDLAEEGSLLRACTAVGLQPYATQAP